MASLINGLYATRFPRPSLTVLAFALALMAASAPGDALAQGAPADGAALASADGNLGVAREAGGLTPDEAARQAVETSRTVAQSRAAQRVAEAAADSALVAAFPRLDLSARYTRLSSIKQGGFSTPPSQAQIDEAQALIDAVDDPDARALFQSSLQQDLALANFSFPLILNQYAFKAGLTFPVSDIFLTVLPAYNASTAFADAEALRVKAQKEIVALQAREAYYSYARARAALAVAEANAKQIESQRLRIDALVTGGSLPRVDLVRMDALLAAANVGVAQARGNVAVAAHALRTLLHVKKDDKTTPGSHIAMDIDMTSVPDEPKESDETLLERAVTKRSEILALKKLREGRDHAVDGYSAMRLPHLNLNGNVDVANPNQRVFPQTEEFKTTWDVSAVLSWSPNDLFGAGADVARAEAQLAQTEADLAALEDAVRLEVTSALETLRAARASLGAAAKAVEAAEETHRVREQQLSAGAIVATELIEAEEELQKARLQQVNAVIEVRVADARLRRASGG